MTSKPSNIKHSDSEKRDTLQINQQQPVSQELIQIDSDKENLELNSKQKKKRRYSNLFPPEVSRKKTLEYVELFSQTGPDSIKFPVFEDKQVGIPKKFQNQLCNPYDMDDDVQTKGSVQKYFVNVCLEDLEEGMRINLGDHRKWVSLKKIYKDLENDIN